jgi:hypothetical protein
MTTNSNEPIWEKLKDGLYQIIDDNGGIYQIHSRVEMTQEQLFSRWGYVYFVCGKQRPAKGEIHLMVQ